jgi:hypothetical protein
MKHLLSDILEWDYVKGEELLGVTSVSLAGIILTKSWIRDLQVRDGAGEIPEEVETTGLLCSG